jgi:hypothetical protein
MGKIDNLVDFTKEHIKNRDLIISMLKYEDSIILGKVADKIFKSGVFELFNNLETTFIFHRLTLNKFNFNSDDNSISNYRQIFKYYFKSPTDYDKEVINSVSYMRENRCIFFTEDKLNKDDIIPDVELFHLNGHTKVKLHEMINKEDNLTFIGAFSNS